MYMRFPDCFLIILIGAVMVRHFGRASQLCQNNAKILFLRRTVLAPLFQHIFN